MIVEKIEGWMLTALITAITFIGWFFKTSHTTTAIKSEQDKMQKQIDKLQEKSNERGEVVARMDERQIGMANDLTEIKKLLQSK